MKPAKLLSTPVAVHCLRTMHIYYSSVFSQFNKAVPLFLYVGDGIGTCTAPSL